MKTLTIIDNPLKPDGRDPIACDDICAALKEHFGTWPKKARLYHREISEATDVTPLDSADIERLNDLPGPFFAVVYPGTPASLISSLIYAVISIGVRLIVSSLSGAKQQRALNYQPSASNQLSDRTNQPRVLKRIEDHFGEVRAFISLLQIPFRYFIKDTEYELIYGCVGRGSYDINSDEVRDGETRVLEIAGESVEIYGPNTSPNSGDEPQMRIGPAINKKVLLVQKSNSVDGQTLWAPNYKTIIGNEREARIWFKPQDRQIWTDSPDAWTFKKRFEVGEYVKISMTDLDTTTVPGGKWNLNGTYLIDEVNDTEIVLHNPQDINPFWNYYTMVEIGLAAMDVVISTYTGGPSADISSKTIGPFIVGDDQTDKIVCNLVALNGLYRTNGSSVEANPVTIRIYTQPVNSAGTPTGALTAHEFVVPSSKTNMSERSLTCEIAVSGRTSVSAVRTTFTYYWYEGTVADDVQWRDLYAIGEVSDQHFGDVTTVQALTRVTSRSLGLRERKLNMLVCRWVRTLNSDGTISTALSASKQVKDIYCHVATDPYIGRRSDDEINGKQIYDELAEVQSYFGTTEATEFGFTIDDENESAEESLARIARAAFCEDSRRGNKIEFHFERETNDSKMLFNHRNMIPGTMKKVVTFGNRDGNDGVEYAYVDKNNMDAPAVFRVPEDGSARVPLRLTARGQRNFKQIYWTAYREYYKILHQHIAVEFTATREAAVVPRLERIRVADRRVLDKKYMQEGEVIAQSGLTLTLSQKPKFEAGKTYTMFLQIPDASVDAIAITPGTKANEIVLASAPSNPLMLDWDAACRAKYMIVPDDDAPTSAFIVSEKDESDGFTYPIRAMSYDARFYQKDHVTPA